MKIAIFTDTFLPQINGVVSVARQSAEALGTQGHEVLLVTTSKLSSRELNAMAGGYGVVTIPSLDFWAYHGERFTLPLGWSLYNIAKFRPDVIHCHTPFAVGWEAIICAKALKISLVGTHHTFFDHYLAHIKLDYDWMKKMSWKYCSFFYNRADLILSPSEALNSGLKSNGLKRLSTVNYNPIDTELFKPAASLEVLNNLKVQFKMMSLSLVYMGRLSYEKSIDKVIIAFAKLKKTLPEIKLMIIGDGPDRKNLEQLTCDLEVSIDVIFTGMLSGQQLVDALSINDVFITASKSENMPISVLEAMATGLPVIGVNANGMSEVVSGDTGFLAEPDNIDELVDCMLALLNDSERRKTMASAARLRALEFSRVRFAEKLSEYYKLIM